MTKTKIVSRWWIFNNPGFGAALLLCCLTAKGLSQNDTLRLKNGDSMIGELKSMDKGVATVSTDYSDDDFKVKWLEVVRVSSNRKFLVTLRGGKRLNTTFGRGTDENKVLVSTGEEGGLEVDIKDVVFVKAVKSDFFSRLTAEVSVGVNFTKSNNLKQFTTRSSLSYNMDKWSLDGTFNSVTNSQDDAENTKRTNGNVRYTYYLDKDWFVTFTSDLLSNDEQKLKIRATNRAGVGNYFIHTNRLYVGGGLGLAWNVERYNDDAGTKRNSMESYLGLEANLFDIGDLDLFTNVVAYPSLTEKGRFRTDIDLDLKYDLPLDFFIKLGLSYNFDNKPVEGASNGDYVLQLTFGWEFND